MPNNKSATGESTGTSMARRFLAPWCGAFIVISMALGRSADGAGADPWIKSMGNTNAPIYDGFGTTNNVPANKGVEWLRVFDGHVYAAVGQEESGTGNPLSVWRSSDLTNWTRVGTGTFSTNDIDSFSIEADGSSHLFMGTHVTPGGGGANIYSSTDGTTWTNFNTGTSGFVRNGATWASHMTVANGVLFAGVIYTNGTSQVWKRPVDGSANWTKVVDFYTGLGLTVGAKANFIATCLYPVSNTIFMAASGGTNACLFQSTDLAGTNWVTNTQVGNGFGDTNNLNLASLVVFNGSLYATLHNVNAGGQLWRTPLTNALANGGLPWTKVVDRGFGQGAQITELHHISAGLGCLWISVQGPVAQVWRSADGTNWIQSNTDGFDASNPATSYKPVVETFNNVAVWGGASGTNPSGAQVWETGLRQQTLTVHSVHGGAMPSGTVTTTWGAALSCFVTNSPVTVGGTQYVCRAAAVAGNDYAQVSPTNATLTLTNDAVLTWQWQTNYWLSPSGSEAIGSVSATSDWFALGTDVPITASASNYYHFASWSGDTNGCWMAGNAITAAMTQARSIAANFSANTVTNGPLGTATPEWWLASFYLPADFAPANTNDTDGDRMPAWAEYIAGTNPTNALSCLRMDALAASGGATGMVIRWASVTGRLYAVDRGTNLLALPPLVNLASNIVGQASHTTYTDTNATGSGPYFYRIGVP